MERATRSRGRSRRSRAGWSDHDSQGAVGAERTVGVPRQPHKLLKVSELAKLSGVSHSRMLRWLKALERDKGGVLIKFSENGKYYSSVELLRRAMPEMHPPGTPTGDEVAEIQRKVQELHGICQLLRSRYRDLRSRLDRVTPKI